MSVAWLLALLVLIISIFAALFATVAPPWLGWLLFGMLALAILVYEIRIPWRGGPA